MDSKYTKQDIIDADTNREVEVVGRGEIFSIGSGKKKLQAFTKTSDKSFVVKTLTISFVALTFFCFATGRTHDLIEFLKAIKAIILGSS